MSGLSLQQQQAHRMSNRNTVETQTIKGCATRGQSINSGDGKVAGDLQNIELTENPPARQKGQENQETRKPRETLGATKLGQNYKGPPGQENPDIPDYPRAWFYPILPWGAPPSAFSRKRIRGHQLMIAWEFLILANVSYLMVEVPYTLTFALPYDHGLPVCEWTWKIAFDCFSCFVFAIDIVFQMHSAVFEGEVLGGHWHLVDKLSDIRWRYIKCMDPFARSFFWDIMCVIPFIQMSCVVWRESRAVLKTYPELYNPSTGLTLNLTTWVDARRAWWTQDPVLSNSKLISMITGWQILQALSLFRVLKVFRLWKLSETAAHVTRRSPVWAAVIAVANMIYYLFFSAHYLGCMWFWLGTPPPGAADFDSSWTNLEGRIWSEQEDGSFRRVLVANTDCDGWLIDVTRCGWLYEWSAAFYWAITTMTTIGYGDISAHNTRERIFCSIAMTMGAAYFAWLAGTVTGILAKGSAGTERFLAFVDEVRQFMAIKNFSEEVKNMVFVFYGLKFPTQLIFNDQEIMDSVPKGLRKRMVAEMYMDLVETIPLFENLSQTTKIEVCVGFETYFCSPQEELCCEDEEPDAFFIVRAGDVLLSCKGVRVAVARRGDVFGEIGLMGLTPSGRRMRTAVALTECELLRMSKDHFAHLILSNDELRLQYRKLVCKFMRIIQEEMMNLDSPVHDMGKMVHIWSAWQTGKVAENLRTNAKLPPPVIKEGAVMGASQVTMVTTHVTLKIQSLKGLPFVHEARGSLSLRFRVEYDVSRIKKDSLLAAGHTPMIAMKSNSHPRCVQKDLIFVQGGPCECDLKTIIRYKHTLEPEDAIVHRADIEIKLIYVRWHDGEETPSKNSAKALPAPCVETEIGSFTIPLKWLVQQRWNEGTNSIEGRWHVGDESGPLELELGAIIGRDLPSYSVIKKNMRPLYQSWLRKAKERIPKATRGVLDIRIEQTLDGAKKIGKYNHVVKFTAALPISLMEFMLAKRVAFIEAVAAAAQVDPTAVVIDNLCSDPKKGLELTLNAPDAPAAASMASLLTTDRINAQMANQGLSAHVVMLQAPIATVDDAEMLGILREIKRSVANMISKGNSGKTSETIHSFEHAQEKQTDDILQLLRMEKIKTNQMFDKLKHVELHMNEKMQQTLDHINRCDASESIRKTQEQIKDAGSKSANQLQSILESLLQKLSDLHLENQQRIASTEKATFEHIERLQARIEKVGADSKERDAESKERDERIIKLLEQISNRQAAPMMTAGSLGGSATQAWSTPNPQPYEPENLRNRGIGSVGLILGQLLTVASQDGKPRVHLQVEGVMPGGSAEMCGMFRAGDEIMAVDGVALDGKTEIEAKRMFLGHDGSIMQLSVLRPSTGKHFSVSLRRHVLTEDAAGVDT